MKISPSALRKNIYNLLDQVLETNIPIEIERKGKILKIVPEQKTDKLKNLKKHNTITGDPMDLVHMDWSSEWKHDPI